jgi:hypothetical protein
MRCGSIPTVATDKPRILGYRSESQGRRQSNTVGVVSVACALLAASAIVSEIVNVTLVGSEIVNVAK